MAIVRAALAVLALVTAVAGVVLFQQAQETPAYSDPALFHEQMRAMDAGDSQAYFQLRERLLTDRYRRADYGVTLVVVGVLAGLLAAFGRRLLCTPSSRTALAATGLLAPVVFGFAALFDIVELYVRRAMPPWADSPGPLVFAAVAEWFLLTCIAAAHLGFLRGGVSRSVPLRLALSWRANPWLSLLASASLGCAAALFGNGSYAYALSFMWWSYFFFSLSAVRRAARLNRA